MRSRFLRFAILLFVLGAFALALKISAAVVLKRSMESLFAKETGCAVNIERSRFFFFPLKGEVSGVRLQAPGEKAPEGFFADRVSVRLNFTELFNRRVLLENLRIQGARVDSRREDSAFFRTLDFILEDEEEKPGEIEEWPVMVTDVVFERGPLHPTSLLLLHQKFRFSWHDLTLAFTRSPVQPAGAPDTPSFAVTARTPAFHLLPPRGREYAFPGMIAAGVISEGKLSFKKAEVTLPGDESNKLTAEGEMELELPGSYNVEVAASLSTRNLQALVPELREVAAQYGLSGSITGVLRGELEDPQLAGQSTLRAANAVFATADEQCALREISAQFLLNEDGLDLRNDAAGRFQPDVKLFLAFDKTLSINGELALRQDNEVLARCLRESLRKGAGAPLPASLGGSISGALDPRELKIAFDGAWAGQGGAIKGAVSWKGDEAQIDYRETVARAGLSVSVRANTANDVFHDAEIEAERFPASVALNRASVVFPSADLQRISAFVTPETVIDAKGSLDLEKAPSPGEFDVALRSFKLGGEIVPSLKAKIRLASDGTKKISALTEIDTVPISAEVTVDHNGALDSLWQISSAQNTVAVSSPALFAPDAHLQVEGKLGDLVLDGPAAKRGLEALRVAGTLEYSLPLSAPFRGKGEILLSQLAFRQGKIEGHNISPVAVSLEQGEVGFRQMEMQIGDRPLRVVGTVSWERGWDAEVQGSWELDEFVPRFASMEQISGTVNAAVKLTGEAASPQLAGKLSLDNGSVSLRLERQIIGVNDVKASADLQGDEIILTEIRGQAGEGDVSGSGHLTKVFSNTERAGEIQLAFRDLTIHPAERVAITLAGEPVIGLRGESAAIKGTITVTSGTYERRLSLSEIVREVTRTVIGFNARERYGRSSAGGQTTGGVALDLRIVAEDSFLVDTDVIRTALSADLAVQGTTAAPAIAGIISAGGGRFGLSSTQFEVINGRAIFRRGDLTIDPSLEILGEGLVGGEFESERIQIAVSGRLSQPRVSFSSDRGLSDREVFSLLAGDRSRSEGSVLTIRPGSGGTLERALTGVTGFSKIDVGYGFSTTTGEFVPKVVALRPLVGKFSLDLESELGETPSSSVGVRYPLSRRLDALVGWRNGPTLEDPDSTSGSLDVGVQFSDNFPETGLIPWSLLGIERP